jgi:hypothetical protein
MENKNKDLYLAIVISLLAMLFTSLNIKLSAFRLLYGIPLAFFLPGYTLTGLFFPSYRLDWMERLLFRIGMSICIVIFAGFLLNVTGYGLQPISWAVFLGLFTIILAFTTIIKKRWEEKPTLTSTQIRIRPLSLFLLACSVLITGGAYVFERNTTIKLSHTYTQLWIAPATNGHPNGLEFGIKNMEDNPKSYHLVVQTDQGVLQNWPSITLSPGQTWDGMLDLPQIPLQGGYIKALLYLQDSPSQVYRSVSWWPALKSAGVLENSAASVLR